MHCVLYQKVMLVFQKLFVKNSIILILTMLVFYHAIKQKMIELLYQACLQNMGYFHVLFLIYTYAKD